LPPSRQDITSDQELLARSRNGDHAAFRQIVERYESLVARTVTGMLGPGAEAEDVGQTTFIRFYHALDQVRADSGIGPYLTRIAVNQSLNALQRRKKNWARFFRRDDVENSYIEPASEGERIVHRKERVALVRNAIQALNPKHRAVVVLRLIDGYSTKETAELLGVPLGTVLSRLSRAQQNLKDLLAPYIRDENE